MTERGERRRRTERVVCRRLRNAASDHWRKTPGRLKKRSPVCYCTICRLSRKPVRRPK